MLSIHTTASGISVAIAFPAVLQQLLLPIRAVHHTNQFGRFRISQVIPLSIGTGWKHNTYKKVKYWVLDLKAKGDCQNVYVSACIQKSHSNIQTFLETLSFTCYLIMAYLYSPSLFPIFLALFPVSSSFFHVLLWFLSSSFRYCKRKNVSSEPRNTTSRFVSHKRNSAIIKNKQRTSPCRRRSAFL